MGLFTLSGAEQYLGKLRSSHRRSEEALLMRFLIRLCCESISAWFIGSIASYLTCSGVGTITLQCSVEDSMRYVQLIFMPLLWCYNILTHWERPCWLWDSALVQKSWWQWEMVCDTRSRVACWIREFWLMLKDEWFEDVWIGGIEKGVMGVYFSIDSGKAICLHKSGKR